MTIYSFVFFFSKITEDAGRDENEKESGIDSESDQDVEDTFNAFTTSTPTCPDDVIRRKKTKKATSSSSPEDIVSRLAKRQSYSHVNFAADDIDAFIASVTVPPPPKDDRNMIGDEPGRTSTPRSSLGGGRDKRDTTKPAKIKETVMDTCEESEGLKKDLVLEDIDVFHPHKVVGRDSWNEFLAQSSPLEDIRIEDDFAQYVIPPPQSESNVIDLASIPMVLPPTLSPSDTPTDSPRSVGSAEEVVRQSSEISSKQTGVRQTPENSSSSQNSAKPKPSSIKPTFPSSTSSMHTSASAQKASQQSDISPTKPTQIPPKPKVDPQSKPKLNLNAKNQIESPRVDTETKKETLKQKDSSKDRDSVPNVSKPAKGTVEEKLSVTKTNETRQTESKSGIKDKSSGDGKQKPAPISSKPSTSSLVNGDLAGSSSQINPPAIAHARSMSQNDAEPSCSPRDKRVAPPAPPKRQSSLDTFNQPISPRMNLPKTNTTKKERPQSALLSDNRDNQSTSGNGGKAVAPSFGGTLPRGVGGGGGGGKRKSAPPPPPRRTSAITTSAEMHELSRSVDNLQVQPPKFSTFGQHQGRSYQRMFGNQSRVQHSNNTQSETNIFNMFQAKSSTNAMTQKQQPQSSQSPSTHSIDQRQQSLSPRRDRYRGSSSPRHSTAPIDGTPSGQIRTAGDRLGTLPRRRQSSESSDSATGSPRSRAKFVSPTIAAKQNAIATAFSRSVSHDSESSLSSSGGLSSSRSGAMPGSPGTQNRGMPGSPLSPRGLYQKPSSPLGSPRKTFRPGSPLANKSSSFRPGSPVTRRQSSSGSAGSPSPSPSRANPPGSPLSRSNSNRSNSNIATTLPRPNVSPQTSPAMHRHSSFSKAADRSAAPFKTFLGDNTGDSKVTSSGLNSSRSSFTGSSSPRTPVSLFT